MSEVPPSTWVWSQTLDLADPPEAVALQKELLELAFRGYGHGGAFGPGPGTYAFAVGDSVQGRGVDSCFLAMPVKDADGTVRYRTMSKLGPSTETANDPVDAEEVRQRFVSFLAFLP